jgi:hypothetical protein
VTGHAQAAVVVDADAELELALLAGLEGIREVGSVGVVELPERARMRALEAILAGDPMRSIGWAVSGTV